MLDAYRPTVAFPYGQDEFDHVDRGSRWSQSSQGIRLESMLLSEVHATNLRPARCLALTSSVCTLHFLGRNLSTPSNLQTADEMSPGKSIVVTPRKSSLVWDLCGISI